MELAKTGLLEGRRVELIRGRIVEMSATGPNHRLCVLKGDIRLGGLFNTGETFVACQLPSLTEDSGPEPDLAIRRGQPLADLETLPMLLVIEVSDTSLAYDRTTKLSIYAEAGYPEYWVVDIPNRRLIVHRGPESPANDAGRYADVRTFADDARVAPAFAPDRPVPVADLLP